jgi:hypothetical protein
VQKGISYYVLGAKHCIQGSVDNNTVAKITTVDTSPRFPGKYLLAAGMDCRGNGNDSCLVPETVDDSAKNDFFAWRPDNATTTDKVQTKKGLLPVLGVKKLDSILGGERVCHYGYKSAQKGKAERCGFNDSAPDRKIACKYFEPKCLPGMVVVPMPSFGGDSGGPAYIYNSKKTGVYAVGLVINGDLNYCVSKGRHCIGASVIMPISNVTDRLKVTLNTKKK